MKTKKINGWQYETQTHDFGKPLEEIKIPKGWQLWDVSDFEKFGKKEFEELNLWESWFFIKQPIKVMEEEGYVARFDADSGWADLGCGWVAGYRGPALGVRFKRRVKI